MQRNTQPKAVAPPPDDTQRQDVDELRLNYRLHSSPLKVRRTLKKVQLELSAALDEDLATVSDAILVLAEVLNNVCEHSYLGKEGGQVEVQIAVQPDLVEMTIRDTGLEIPADLLKRQKLPAVSASLPSLPEGGFGWFLIHTMVQNLAYRRADGENALSFSVMRAGGDTAAVSVS